MACTSLGVVGLFLLIFSPDSTSAVIMGLGWLFALTLVSGSILVIAMMIATNTTRPQSTAPAGHQHRAPARPAAAPSGG